MFCWLPVQIQIQTHTYLIDTSKSLLLTSILITLSDGTTTYVARSNSTQVGGTFLSGSYDPSDGITYIIYASAVYQLTTDYELLIQESESTRLYKLQKWK